jgi:hypothetical protein
MPRHPIEDFVSNRGFENFKVPQMPNLSDLVKDNGFGVGTTQFGARLLQWRTDLERAINERLRIASTTDSTTTGAQGPQGPAGIGLPGARGVQGPQGMPGESTSASPGVTDLTNGILLMGG